LIRSKKVSEELLFLVCIITFSVNKLPKWLKFDISALLPDHMYSWPSRVRHFLDIHSWPRGLFGAKVSSGEILRGKNPLGKQENMICFGVGQNGRK